MKPNYTALSFVYDLIDVIYFNRKNRSPRTALIDIIPDTPVRILDVCAGTCSNSILIAENKPQAKITALDLSADMLKIAEKKFCKKNIRNIEISVTDACNSGFPNNSFDIILISLVLHEINEDLRKSILSEVKRLLTSNGRVIIIEWKQPVRLFQRIMFTPIKLLEPRGFKKFLQQDLTSYFKQKGFSINENRNCDYTQVIVLSITK